MTRTKRRRRKKKMYPCRKVCDLAAAAAVDIEIDVVYAFYYKSWFPNRIFCLDPFLASTILPVAVSLVSFVGIDWLVVTILLQN
jgi:hypothetical protein